MISWGPLRSPAGHIHLKAPLALCLAAAGILALSVSARAATDDPPQPSAYADAVQRAYDVIQGAQPQDPVPARFALQLLENGTGNTQPEIAADLKARPPRYEDARKRLSALLDALNQPATTSDPDLAQQRLHEVMSQSRYDALHRPPSLFDRIGQWIQDRIAQFFRLLGRSGAQPPAIWLYATGILVLLAVAIVLVRASGGRFSQAGAVPSGGPRPPADYFAEADSLAAKGDRVGAIRALCAAVAATLAGERSWEGSPLTVREIFHRAPDYESLRPLLLPFEAAVYGGRDVDESTYRRAAQVAAPYRRPVKDEAA